MPHHVANHLKEKPYKRLDGAIIARRLRVFLRLRRLFVNRMTSPAQKDADALRALGNPRHFPIRNIRLQLIQLMRRQRCTRLRYESVVLNN